MRALAVTAAAAAASAAGPQKPNIVFFLTDDQDQMLGGSFPPHNGVTPMPNSWAKLGQAGKTATNMFIHTPICCPSRAETLTGRYFHNVKSTGKCLTGYTGGPGTPGECCFHVDNDKVLNNTFAKSLKTEGYTVGLFGKFLNAWPGGVGAESGGAAYAPPGFDAWLANGGGSYYAPSFVAKGVDDLGFPEGRYHAPKENYTTAVVGNASVAWIKKVAPTGKPFFAYIAPKACHEEFAPAPWYKDFWHPSWPETEPRPVSWNMSFEDRTDHHHNVAVAPLITPAAARQITMVFKDRWRTLMSVDDVVEAVLNTCDAAGVSQHTYFFSSSDHGFQLGEFNLPFDKRQVYDHNTRIHLLVRGPGIQAGTTLKHMVTNVDLAPTFLGLAGASGADHDGKSMVPLLVTQPEDALPATREHLRTQGLAEDVAAGWRDSVFIEYYYVQLNTKCMPYSPLDPVTGHPCRKSEAGCHCTNIEDSSNNFIAVRHTDGEFGDTLYSEFQTSPDSDVFFDKPDFVEYYNVAEDPWSVNNLINASSTNKTAVEALHQKLHSWFQCSGSSCP